MCLDQLIQGSTANNCEASFLHVNNVGNGLWNTAGLAQNVFEEHCLFQRFHALIHVAIAQRHLHVDTHQHIDDALFFVPVVTVARTTKRAQTLFDAQPTSPPGVCHIPMAEPFCNRTREVSKEPSYL